MVLITECVLGTLTHGDVADPYQRFVSGSIMFSEFVTTEVKSKTVVITVVVLLRLSVMVVTPVPMVLVSVRVGASVARSQEFTDPMH